MGTTHTKSRAGPLLILSIVLVAVLLASSCVHHAQPNEWLLVVDEQGRQTKAVVGGTHVSSPYEQVVKFPSNLQKVSFRAQQVTREMQGIEVSGFASWVVYREDSGPLKAYRHLNGLTTEGIDAANDSLRHMAESILRAKLANLTIAEVLTSRELLRDVCQKSMMEVVRGWGVWIETLEVTDVKILSSSLFNNMQTPFREATRLEAEIRQLETQREIKERQMTHDQRLAKQKAELEVQNLETQHRIEKRAMALELEQATAKAEIRKKRVLFEAEQELLLREQKDRLSVKEHELELARLEREHEATTLRKKHSLALDRQLNEHKRSEAEALHQLQIKHLTDKIQAEQQMTDSNHKAAQREATKEVFSRLPLKEVKLVNFGTPVSAGTNSSYSDSMGLLPGLWAGVHS